METEGVVLALFYIVALAGLVVLMYPAITGSMTASPCTPLPSVTAAHAPAPPAAPPRSSRTGDRSFFVDETGVIRYTTTNYCPPSSQPLGG